MPTVERVEEPREEECYQRHNYMDLFSPANPRVFGDEGEAPDLGRGYEERETLRDTFEERGGEDSVENRREGINLLDDDDDPYTLRSDYDEPHSYDRGVAESRDREEIFEERGRESIEEVRGGRGFEEPAPVAKPEPPKPVEPPKPRIIRPYKRVPLDDFDCRVYPSVCTIKILV